MIFTKDIVASFDKNMLTRYFLAGKNVFQIVLLKFCALFFVYSICTIPFLIYFGINLIIMNLISCAIIILISSVVKQFETCNFYLFFTSFFMLFISGTLIPYVFLPNVIKKISFLTPNFWVLKLGQSLTPLIVVMIQLFLCLALSIFFVRRKK